MLSLFHIEASVGVFKCYLNVKSAGEKFYENSLKKNISLDRSSESSLGDIWEMTAQVVQNLAGGVGPNQVQAENQSTKVNHC